MKYLVNRTTKEHLTIADEKTWIGTDWYIVHADSEGWIDHVGSECPLSDGVKFQARRRDGELAAEVTSWAQGHGNRTITYYRPILAEKVQEPEPIRPHKWDAEGERCVKCGDKDWMASQSCDESKVQERDTVDEYSPWDAALTYHKGDKVIMPDGEKTVIGGEKPAPQYDPRSVSFNLLDRLKAAHEHAQTIPDLEAELREVLGSMGYDLVARSPFVEPEPSVETPQDNKYAAEW